MHYDLDDMAFLETVEEAFKTLPKKTGSSCTNPITGGRFIRDLDRMKPQKEAAFRALKARAAFARENPSIPYELPLTYPDREMLKTSRPALERDDGEIAMFTIEYLLALYARSLEANDYDLQAHPSFVTYLRGMMALDHFAQDVPRDLKRQYPPINLPGLDNSGYYDVPRRSPKTRRRSVR
jgi:hypothetical protein